MNNSKSLDHQKIALLTVSILFVCTQTCGFADGFNTAEIIKETSKIRDFLFGPAAKTIAMFGGAWGLYLSIISGSFKPLLIYGAIGLAAVFLPKFIDMVF